MKAKNQYQRVVIALRIKAMTTWELALAVGSTCVWKRRKEAIMRGYMRIDEKLVEGTRRVNGKTLKTWKIVRI